MRTSISVVLLSLASFALSAPATSTLKWSPCPSPLPPALQCAQLKVPLDWSQPKKEQVTLGITKVPAKNQETKKGSLFYNPGGPGEPASNILMYQAQGYSIFGEALVNNFDIVGVDPRGTGMSQPLTCDPDKYNAPWPKFPQSQADFDGLVNYNKAFWQSCSNMTGALLGHVDTISVAKDHEAVRKAIGAAEFNFLGESYGSQLGSQYAALYSDNFRAIVLDGNVDHSQSTLSTFEAESATYEAELTRFISWCESNTTCALNGKNVTKVWTDLVDSAFAQPIPAPGCKDPAAGCKTTVHGGDILFGAQGFLVWKEVTLTSLGKDWPGLAVALEQAVAGNATLLSYPSATSKSDSNFAGPAISCQDFHTPVKTFADLEYIYELASYTAPLTLGASQTYWIMISCIGYPLPVSNPPATLRVKNSKSNTILMTNSRYDPETSLVWAEGLREQIAYADLVVRAGDGHTSYNLGGETTALIESYLVNMTLPGENVITQS